VNCLFVGGYADGQWIDVPTEDSVMGRQPRHDFMVDVHPPLSSFDPNKPVVEAATLRRAHYIRTIWTCGPERRFIFARKDMEPHAVFDCLLNNYRGAPTVSGTP